MSIYEKLKDVVEEIDREFNSMSINNPDNGALDDLKLYRVAVYKVCKARLGMKRVRTVLAVLSLGVAISGVQGFAFFKSKEDVKDIQLGDVKSIEVEVEGEIRKCIPKSFDYKTSILRCTLEDEIGK